MAHIGIVEVDAPVASCAGGNEAVPRLNADRTAGSTDTLRETGKPLKKNPAGLLLFLILSVRAFKCLAQPLLILILCG